MASENDILIALQESVRTALYAAANKEIEKCRTRFENEMTRMKREIVCEMVNQIQITASHGMPGGEYIIQIRLNAGQK